MSIHPDFEDFLRLLEEHHVDSMIVGGFAVAFHGFPRFTKDLDIFFADDRENLARLHAAIVAFGFHASMVSVEVLRRPDSVFSIGLEPVRIDLLNAIAGISFHEARHTPTRPRRSLSSASRRSPSDCFTLGRSPAAHGVAAANR
ncbi:MAG: nucleotidyltransferase [Planctomycetia bacterium]